MDQAQEQGFYPKQQAYQRAANLAPSVRNSHLAMVRLHPDDIEQVAQRVVALLKEAEHGKGQIPDSTPADRRLDLHDE